MEFTASIERQEAHTLINIEGHLISNYIHIMEGALANAMKLNHKHIVIDCSELISINADGLKLLLQTQVDMTGEYYLSLNNVPDSIADLLELSGLPHFIQISTQAEQPLG